jgi:hypothetical protein
LCRFLACWPSRARQTALSHGPTHRLCTLLVTVDFDRSKWRDGSFAAYSSVKNAWRVP